MATMLNQDVTRRLTILAEERGFSQLASHFQNLEKAMSSSGASIKTTEKQFAALERQLLPAEKSLQDLQRVAGGAFKAVASGAVDAERGVRLLTAAFEKFDSARASKSARESASVFESEIKRLESVRSKYDHAYRAGKDYSNAVKEINEAHKAGVVSDRDRLVLIQRQRAEYRRVMEDEVHGGREGRLGQMPGNRLSLYQAQNLSFQVNDVLTGLMSGQSPGMIAAQQGGQIFQILSDGPGGIGGSVKRLGGYLAGLMTPIRIVTGGLTALGAAGVLAFNDATNRMIAMQQALNGFGALSGQTVGGLNRLANAGAAGGNISIATAQGLAGGYAGAGLGGGSIATLLGSTRDFAKAFGLSVEDAGKELAQAFRDPMKGAEDLNRRFGTFNDALFESIRRAQEQGDMSRAQALLMRAYSDAQSTLIIRTNAISEAFEKTKNVLSDMWTRLGQAVSPATAQERLDAAMSAPRYATGQMSRRMRQNLAMRGIDPDEAAGQVEANRRNATWKAWVDAITEAGERFMRQREVGNSQLSRVAGGYIRETTPWEENAKRFEDRIKAISDALRAGAAGDADRAAEALERLGNAARLNLPPMQQMQLNASLQIQQTLAMTVAQRAAVDAQRAYLSALAEGRTRAEAAAAAENAVNQARAEGLKQSLDALRDARNQSRLAGLLPDERLRMENQIRIEELRRQTEVGSNLPGVFVPFKLGLDTATSAVTSFTSALVGSVAAMGGKPPDAEWRAQLKHSERAGSMWAGGSSVPISPFGEMPVMLGYKNRNDLQRRLEEMLRGSASTAIAPASVVGGNRNGGLAVNPNAARVANDNTRDLLETARQQEIYSRYIRQTEIATTALSASLDSQIRTFGQSQSAVAAAAKEQELLNQAAREGVPVTDALRASIARVSKEYGEQVARQERLRESMQTLNDLRSGFADFGNSLASAFMRGERGAKLLQAGTESLLNTLSRMSMNFLMKGLFGNQDFSGGLLSQFLKFLVPSANGNVFAGGHLMAFASGGVVDRPTLFPMARGAGLMGEAGPEAILPLRRGSDGRLGVSAQQGGGRSVVNIHNYGNSEVRTEDRGEGPDGSRMLDIFIEEKVNSMLTSGRGDAAMTRFGSRPAKVRWGG